MKEEREKEEKKEERDTRKKKERKKRRKRRERHDRRKRERREEREKEELYRCVRDVCGSGMLGEVANARNESGMATEMSNRLDVVEADAARGDEQIRVVEARLHHNVAAAHASI